MDSGNPGIGSRTVTWTLDRTAPRVLDVIDITTDPRNIVVQRIDVEFSEPIDLASLEASDLVLTRTGSTTNLLVNENRLSYCASDWQRLSNLGNQLGSGFHRKSADCRIQFHDIWFGYSR